MITLCGVRAIGRSRWSDECGRSGVIIDRRGTPLCHEHAYLADRSETPSDDIKHVTWLIRDILEADSETAQLQVSQGQVKPAYCIKEVDTVAEGLVIRLGDGDLYEVMIAKMNENTG